MRVNGSWAAAIAVAVVVTSGCTLSTVDDDAPPTSASQTTGDTPSSIATATDRTTPEGLEPEELAAQVFAAGDATAEVAPIGSVTAPVADLENRTATFDVVRVARIEGATLVEMRLSVDGDPVTVIPGDLDSGIKRVQSFLRDVLMEDARVSATRYRPLQFTDYRDACLCPHIPVELGTETTTLFAVFPELPPAVQTVTITLGDSPLTIADLPVES